MLKNILRYCCVLLGFGIVFFTISSLNCNVKNEYSELAGRDFDLCPELPEHSLYEQQADTIVYRNADDNASLFDECYYALFINETDHEVYAAKNVHRRMYPASMTKFMTAIIVSEKIEAGEIGLNDTVTINRQYDLTAEDVEPCMLKPGDKITVKDLLYGLLLESNNYFALILADYVSGDTAAFCDLMNQKAYSLGATNTHFMNPHGLDNRDHYSTAYDIYLITKEAYRHELIRTIDASSQYSFTYYDANDVPYDVDVGATNMFMRDKADLPANYHIEVWKTGTTTGAGNCLAMYLTRGDKEYFVVASSGSSKNALYDALVKLLCLI
ncbi:MAG: D-alanyl-D-alanine carboxypeptidase family protein [Wujia sp.]